LDDFLTDDLVWYNLAIHKYFELNLVGIYDAIDMK